jgi:hypothetical protein
VPRRVFLVRQPVCHALGFCIQFSACKFDDTYRSIDLRLKELTGLLEDHLFDSHAEGLAKLLRVLGNDVIIAVVEGRVVRYLVKVAFDFLITKLIK